MKKPLFALGIICSALLASKQSSAAGQTYPGAAIFNDNGDGTQDMYCALVAPECCTVWWEDNLMLVRGTYYDILDNYPTKDPNTSQETVGFQVKLSDRLPKE